MPLKNLTRNNNAYHLRRYFAICNDFWIQIAQTAKSWAHSEQRSPFTNAEIQSRVVFLMSQRSLKYFDNKYPIIPRIYWQRGWHNCEWTDRAWRPTAARECPKHNGWIGLLCSLSHKCKCKWLQLWYQQFKHLFMAVNTLDMLMVKQNTRNVL